MLRFSWKKTQPICIILLYMLKVSLNIHILYQSMNQCVSDKITSKSKGQYKSKERNLITTSI